MDPDLPSSCRIWKPSFQDQPIHFQSAASRSVLFFGELHSTKCLPSSMSSTILLFFRVLDKRTAITIRKDMAMMSRTTMMAMVRLLRLSFDILCFLQNYSYVPIRSVLFIIQKVRQRTLLHNNN